MDKFRQETCPGFILVLVRNTYHLVTLLLARRPAAAPKMGIILIRPGFAFENDSQKKTRLNRTGAGNTYCYFGFVGSYGCQAVHCPIYVYAPIAESVAFRKQKPLSHAADFRNGFGPEPSFHSSRNDRDPSLACPCESAKREPPHAKPS